VGDNVGDIAGMGADLFGSFAEASCAALLVAAVSSLGTEHNMTGMYFPLIISGGWARGGEEGAGGGGGGGELGWQDEEVGL
jgi:hypothetical protein